MPNLQSFLEDSDQADLLHRGLQGLRWKLDACSLWKKSIPVAQDPLVMDLELRLPVWTDLSLSVCPAWNKLAFTVLRLYGFPSTDFSGFGVKNVSTWLTVLPAPAIFSSATGIFLSFLHAKVGRERRVYFIVSNHSVLNPYFIKWLGLNLRWTKFDLLVTFFTFKENWQHILVTFFNFPEQHLPSAF